MDNETTKETTPSTEGVQAPAAATMADFEAALGAHSAPAQAARSETDDATEQRKRVNDGRLKKTAEDLAAANARIKELEEQIAKANAGRPAFDADTVRKFARNPDEIGEDFAETTAAGLNAVREQVRKEMQGEIDAVRAEMTASREAASAAMTRRNLERTLHEVEGVAPGLVVRIARGDLRDRWNSFLEGTDPFSGVTLRDILQGAVRDGRTDAAREVYARFVREAGLSGQYGGVVLAPPRGAAPVQPRSSGAGPVWPSRSAIYEELERLSVAKRRGTIDPKTYAAKCGELEDALRGHRYAAEK